MLRKTRRSSVLPWVLFKDWVRAWSGDCRRGPCEWISSIALVCTQLKALHSYTFCYFPSTILRAVHTPNLQHQRVCELSGELKGLISQSATLLRHAITVLWWDRGDSTPHHHCVFNQSQDSYGSFCFGKHHSNTMVPSALFWGVSIACVCPSQDLVTIWVPVALHFLFQECVADIYD